MEELLRKYYMQNASKSRGMTIGVLVLLGLGLAYYFVGGGVAGWVKAHGGNYAPLADSNAQVLSRKVWPPVNDWRKYFRSVDRDGKIETTVRLEVNGEGELAAIVSKIVDNNSNDVIDGKDYVEAMLKGSQSSYRIYGSGRVALLNGDKEESVIKRQLNGLDIKMILSEAEKVLK